MLRSTMSKVVWVGRATVFLVGLSVIVGLVFGVGSAALAGNLDPLKLGSAKNVATKTTALVGKVASGSAFSVRNPSGGPALDLQVNAGRAPMKVNSSAKVGHLNADHLDGQDSTALWSGKIYEMTYQQAGIANVITYVQESCDPGDILLSGGYAFSDPGDYQVISDVISSNANSMGWHSGNTAVTAYVYLTCADFGSPHSP